jgi:hypothetical protein
MFKRLEDIPEPEQIYNGPLEPQIVPLVKTLTAHFMVTSGSCRGHLDRFYPHPWVQFFPGDDSRLLSYLVEQYQVPGKPKWRVQGNLLRPEMEATDYPELTALQTSIDPLAQFLFEYRPTVLNPALAKNMLPIPTPAAFRRVEQAGELYDLHLRILTTLQEGTVEYDNRYLASEHAKEKIVTAIGDLFEGGGMIILPPEPEQIDVCLARAYVLFDN